MPNPTIPTATLPGIPTDAEVDEWQRLAEIGYSAHRAGVVAPLQGPEWAQAGLCAKLQWIDAAEAIQKAVLNTTREPK
jgi:hypothetical protein